jgi:hypothetical protein
VKALGNLDSAERWFANRMEHGNRNNSMAKYAFMLKDSGMDFSETESRIIAFNGKLSDPLSDTELQETILKSIASKYKEG